jgi:hypothetical protein
VVVFSRPDPEAIQIRMMRGQLITGLESQRDDRTEPVRSPPRPDPVLKKQLDVALHMFENVR